MTAPSLHRPPEELYARVTEFVREVMADPVLADDVKGVVAGLVGYFVHAMDLGSWTTFKTALGTTGAAELGIRVRGWADTAFAEGDPAAGWAHELVAINLSASAVPGDAAADAAGQLSGSVIGKAIAEAAPLDHETPAAPPEDTRP